MNFLRLAGAVIAAIFAVLSAHAASRQMSVTRVIGDGESRSMARDLAVEQMRRTAASEAGKVVETVSSLNDGKLVEAVRTVGVSMVKVANIRERVYVDGNGVLRIHVDAEVTLDESELHRRAEQLRRDVAKAALVVRLGEENAQLTEALKEIGKLPDAGFARAEIAALGALRRQKEIHQEVSAQFEEGKLVELATEDDVRWKLVQIELESSVYDRLLRSNVDARVLWVKKVDGSYEAAVRVDWKNNIDEISRVIGKYVFHDGIRIDSDGVAIVELERAKAFKQSPKSEFQTRVVEHLEKMEVWVEVEIGGVMERLPMLFTWNPKFTPGPYNRCQGVGGDVTKPEWTSVCLVEPMPRSRMVAGRPGVTNPLVFKLTTEQAVQANDLRVRIVRVDAREARAWRIGGAAEATAAAGTAQQGGLARTR